MVQTPVKKLTFEEFLEQYPDGGIYELIDGEIIPVEPTRAHKNVARFLMLGFNDEIRRLGLDYIADKISSSKRLLILGKNEVEIQM